MSEPNILLVEDDHSLCNLITRALTREGMAVECTDSSVDAIMKLHAGAFDAVLLDIMLGGSSGMYVVDAIRDIPTAERPKVVIITAARGNILANVDRSIVKSVMFKPLDVTAVAVYLKSLVRETATL